MNTIKNIIRRPWITLVFTGIIGAAFGFAVGWRFHGSHSGATIAKIHQQSAEDVARTLIQARFTEQKLQSEADTLTETAEQAPPPDLNDMLTRTAQIQSAINGRTPYTKGQYGTILNAITGVLQTADPEARQAQLAKDRTAATRNQAQAEKARRAPLAEKEDQVPEPHVTPETTAHTTPAQSHSEVTPPSGQKP